MSETSTAKNGKDKNSSIGKEKSTHEIKMKTILKFSEIVMMISVILIVTGLFMIPTVLYAIPPQETGVGKNYFICMCKPNSSWCVMFAAGIISKQHRLWRGDTLLRRNLFWHTLLSANMFFWCVLPTSGSQHPFSHWPGARRDWCK